MHATTPVPPAIPIREPQPEAPVDYLATATRARDRNRTSTIVLAPRRPAYQPAFTQPAGPTWQDRLRDKLGNEEWEALVGGSLLNKAGALVLVVGIALFLAYSFGHMTAAGRAVLALIVSVMVLVAES